MKIKNLKELKTRETKDLLGLIAKKKLELIKNQVKLTSSREKNVKRAWLERKEIAQILSIINIKPKQ